MSNVSTIQSPLVDDAYRALVANLLSSIQSGDIKSVDELRTAIRTNIREYYRNPELVLSTFSREDFRDNDRWNENQALVSYYSRVIEKEIQTLAGETTAAYNFVTKVTYDINGKTKAIDAKLEDFKQNNVDIRQFAASGRSIITLSDDFTDLSKIDFSISTDINANPQTSSVTISPEQNINRATNTKNIEVFANKSVDPSKDLITTASSLDGILGSSGSDDGGLPWNPRAYEGYRFAASGQARPEGGAWRIDTYNSKAVGTPGVTDSGIKYDTRYSDLVSNAAPITAAIIPELATAEAPYVKPVTASSPTTTEVTWNIYRKQGLSALESSPLVSGATDIAFADATTIVEGSNTYTHVNKWSQIIPGTTSSIDIDKSSDSTYSYWALEIPGVVTPSTNPASNKYTTRYTPSDYIFDEPVGKAGTEWDSPDTQLMTSDNKYCELPPSFELALQSRMKMIDGDPRTFWEIEWTPYVPALQTTADANVIDRKTALFPQLPTGLLEATIKFYLDAEYTINYLDLTPVYFADYNKAPIVISKLIIDGVNVPIDETVINLDSNAALDGEQIAATGVTDPYAYRGQAFISFTPRKAQKIEITIKQPAAVPNAYDLHNYQLVKKSNYTISQTWSTSSSKSGFLKSSSSSQSKSEGIVEKGTSTILLQDSYFETVAKNAGAATNQTSAANSVATGSGSGTGGGKQNQIGTLLGAVGGGLLGGGMGALVGSMVGGLFNSGSTNSTSSSGNRSYSDSGWGVNLEFNRSIWARPRFAIGISEIGFYSRSYKATGTLNSKEFTVPAGNKVAYLRVRENIPSSFLTYSQTEAFIEYYIIVNGVETRVKPDSGADASIAHEGLPTEVALPTDAVTTTVRFKAVFKRPDGHDFPDAGSLTPILRSYKIIIEDKI